MSAKTKNTSEKVAMNAKGEKSKLSVGQAPLPVIDDNIARHRLGSLCQQIFFHYEGTRRFTKIVIFCKQHERLTKHPSELNESQQGWFANANKIVECDTKFGFVLATSHNP